QCHAKAARRGRQATGRWGWRAAVSIDWEMTRVLVCPCATAVSAVLGSEARLTQPWHTAGRRTEALMMTDLTGLQTPRLRLRRVRPDDLADLAALHNHPQVAVTLGGPRTDAEAAAYLRRQLDHWDRHGF